MLLSNCKWVATPEILSVEKYDFIQTCYLFSSNLILFYLLNDHLIITSRVYYHLKDKQASDTIGSLARSAFSKLHNFAWSSLWKSRKENPQKLTQLSSRSHPRHLVGKRTAQKDITIDTTSDSQVNSNFPNRWSPASLTFNNYFTYFYIYI